MSLPMSALRLMGIFAVLVCSAQPVHAQKAPIVAAAADLRFALESIAERFAGESGRRVELVFGSSGTLTRQAIDGAPFELFLSADEAFVETLAGAGLTRDGGTLYAIGRIVIFAPHGSPLKVDERMEGLRSLLARGGVTRFAIANPEHAPYGRAAEAALRATGLWESAKPSLVLGENIAQAAQFARTGNAVGGMLAYSLVLTPPLSEQGTYALIPDSLHPPLRQRMVILKRAGETARRFYRYLQQPPAREILRKYGFAVPQG
jgi:molybdate transport system substrate-binding protein